MGKLEFTRPVGAGTGISSEYDKWRDVKGKNGKVIGKKQHKGVDYAAPKGTSIQASESGKVIRAAFDPPSEPQGISYGNVIIIDHIPGAGNGKRHIYTLYAHLDGMYVKAGDYVEKYETIGTSGNTGEVGPHLHFEVIDASTELGWSATGDTGIEGGGSIRKKPDAYFDKPTEVEGTLPDMAEQAIMDRIDFVPEIDLKRRDPLRLEAWLDGKNIGYLNKDNGTLKVNLKYDLKEELRMLWRKPLHVPKSEPIKLEYEIKLR